MNPLVEVEKLGQSIWYDNIRRLLIDNGDIAAKIADDDLPVGAAITSSQITCRTDDRRSGRPMRRATSARPAIACSVEPAAMQSAAIIGGENGGCANAAEFQALSRNDPRKTPGQSRGP